MTATTTMMRRALATAALVLGLTPIAHGQAPAARDPEPPIEAERMSPREVQRLFDAYVAMQAQERLQLSETQYPQFLPRLKALLDVRRRTLQTRQSMLVELARTSAAGPADVAALREKLTRLKAFDEQSAAELRQAYEAIDQMLDVRQQARFRVFEDQVERRKVELLMRARQNIRNRLRAQPR